MSELMNNESVLGILQGFVWALMGVTFFYGSYTGSSNGKLANRYNLWRSGAEDLEQPNPGMLIDESDKELRK